MTSTSPSSDGVGPRGLPRGTGWPRAGWRLLRGALGALPLSFWLRRVSRGAVALCYHVVSDEKLPHVRHNFPYKTQSMFEDDLEFLSGAFRVVGLEEFLRWDGRDGRGGRPAALVTFDDGLGECHSVVRPCLSRFGLTAVFFVTTDVIDNRAMIYRQKISLCIDRLGRAGEESRDAWLRAIRLEFGEAGEDMDSFRRFALSLRADRARVVERLCDALEIDLDRYLSERRPYLTAGQIRELDAEGFQIGAHGLDHHDFGGLGPGEIEKQIVTSCEIVSAITGRSPVPFAFPFNMIGLDRDWLARIARRNPVVGTMFGTAGPFPDPPYIQRLFVDTPEGAAPGRSNLPRLLRAAYPRLVKARLRAYLP